VRSLPGKTGKEEKIVPLVVSLVIILDRFTKILILHYVRETESLPVIAGYFHITRVNNTGAAFGIMKHSQGVLIGISVFFILGITAWFVKNRHRPLSPVSYGWALVLAGAVSNAYDRVRYGYVIDFLDFRVWPVFNGADISICTGIFLISLSFFLKERSRA